MLTDAFKLLLDAGKSGGFFVRHRRRRHPQHVTARRRGFARAGRRLASILLDGMRVAGPRDTIVETKKSARR